MRCHFVGPEGPDRSADDRAKLHAGTAPAEARTREQKINTKTVPEFARRFLYMQMLRIATEAA